MMSEELHATLMKGKIESVENDNHFFMKALAGDLEGALSDLSSMEGIESDFNRFILEPSKEQYEELKTKIEVATNSRCWRLLLFR